MASSERRQLSPEVVTLVHHVELHRAGWQDKTLRQLILSVLWSAGKPLVQNALFDSLFREYDIRTSRSHIREIIEKLIEENILLKLEDGRYKITEEYTRQLHQQFDQTNQVNEEAKAIFIQLIDEYCPELSAEEVWFNFNDRFLLPTVRQIGARTYELITGNSTIIDEDHLAHFLELFPEKHHLNLRKAIDEFMTHPSSEVRSYVLRYLNAYFSLEATNLQEDTLAALKHPDVKPTFELFIDTNFIFSLLKLHENPSNEAALLLSELITDLPGLPPRFVPLAKLDSIAPERVMTPV